MKRQTLTFMALTALLGTFLVSCEKKHAQTETLTLMMAEVNPEDSVCGRMDIAFKEKVEELSEGSIKIDIKFSGILGDEKKVMQQMFDDNDTVQLARVGANLSSYGATKSKLISIPYTFENADHFWNFANSQIAQDILLEPYELGLGVRGLCYAQEGFRNFFCTQPLNSIEDFKGKTMRVSGGSLTAMAEALQAKGENIPFTDLYMALQTGMVEIADQPLSNYQTNSFYAVAPYMIEDMHMIGAIQIMIKSSVWESLTEKQKDIFTQASKHASEYCRTILNFEEAKSRAVLTMNGVQFISAGDMKAWQEVCKDYILECSSDYPELYQSILDLAE